MQCTNNLKQLGLALHNYADVNKDVLPHNTLSAGPFGMGWMSWQPRILPFIEQTALFDKIDWNRANMWDGDNTTIWKDQITFISGFVCPSRAYGEEHYCKGRFADNNDSWRFTSPSDYACCIGDYPNGDGSNGNFSNPGTAGGTGDLFPNYGHPKDSNGPIGTIWLSSKEVFQGRGMFGRFGWSSKLAGVKDGLSNTFAIGESIGGLNPSNGFPSESFATTAWPINHQKAWLDEQFQALIAEQTSGGNLYGKYLEKMRNYGTTFSSEHSGGANFLLGDGSCRFISETIDGAAYRACASRNGKESVSL